MQIWPRRNPRRSFLSRLLQHLIAAVLWLIPGTSARLPQNPERVASQALKDTDDTRLGRAVPKSVGIRPDVSGFYLLPRGLDAFVARAMLALSAERSIDAQYYLLHRDLVGNLFLDLLLEAADRGVRVRLLVDDMALDDDRDIGAAQLDAHPNIEVRVFNPFGRNVMRWLQLLARFGDVTRRMHNKSFTVDNQVTIVGGRNIGDEYFDANPDLLFGDLDVFAVGPAVNDVSSMFDLYWNSDISYPVASLIRNRSDPEALASARQKLDEFMLQNRDSPYLMALHDNPLISLVRDWSFDFEWGDARVLYDHPDKIKAARDQDELKLSTQLNTYTSRVDRELHIISPYFVPGRRGVEMLTGLCQRDVRVHILTNSLASTDVTIVHAGYARYRRDLLRAGVNLYELDETLTREQRRERKAPQRFLRASLHAKSFVLDRKQVFIGSMNFDPRSVLENTEIGMLVESAGLARDIGEWFDDITQRGAFRLELEQDSSGAEQIVWIRELDGETSRFESEPNAGFWRRLANVMLQFFPLESQL